MARPRIDEPTLTAWRSFLNAHAFMLRRIEQELDRHGLPPLSWYDVLWAIRSSPQRRLRISELADEVVISRTGMSRLAARLETAGLLAYEPVPGDRRGTYAALTDAGEKTLRAMWPVYAGVVNELFAPQVADDLEPVTRALGAVADAARERTAEPAGA